MMRFLCLVLAGVGASGKHVSQSCDGDVCLIPDDSVKLLQRDIQIVQRVQPEADLKLKSNVKPESVPAPARPQLLLTTNCQTKLYGKSEHAYGSWTLCTEHLGRATTIISVGIEKNIDFDLAVAREHKATVRCFDPTITHEDFERLVATQEPEPEVRSRLAFLPFGLGHENDVVPFFESKTPTLNSLVGSAAPPGYNPTPILQAPILRLPALLALISPLQIDVLKLDIEGAEFGIFDSSDAELRHWLATSTVSQIALEFHERKLSSDSQKKEARPAVVELLRRCGFHMRCNCPGPDEVLFVRVETVAEC